MKSIISPTDFSTTSLNAVNYAADMAQVIKADLCLIHVYEIPPASGDFPNLSSSLQQIIDRAETKMKEIFAVLRNRIGPDLEISTKVVEGSVLDAIEKHCSYADPYAVVMGAEDALSVERLLFGGISLAAIKHLPWPVIIVPPYVKFSTLQKIGLACDFKEASAIPVWEIRKIVSQFNAELHVLHVRPDDDIHFNDEVEEESKWVNEILSGLHPKYHFLQGDNIENTICEFADTHQIDLLIVVPKKHSLIRKLINRSHSKQMVLHAHVPVMAIHH